jgi:hypothetical protein
VFNDVFFEDVNEIELATVDGINPSPEAVTTTESSATALRTFTIAEPEANAADASDDELNVAEPVVEVSLIDSVAFGFVTLPSASLSTIFKGEPLAPFVAITLFTVDSAIEAGAPAVVIVIVAFLFPAVYVLLPSEARITYVPATSGVITRFVIVAVAETVPLITVFETTVAEAAAGVVIVPRFVVAVSVAVVLAAPAMIAAVEPAGFDTTVKVTVAVSLAAIAVCVIVTGTTVATPTRLGPNVPTVTAEVVTAAAFEGTAETIPKPKAATATSAMRLKVVFVDICFLSISREIRTIRVPALGNKCLLICHERVF